MSTTYGLTAAGFVAKPQSVCLSEIQAQLQQTFGANINLSPESNFGQLAGILSEREALLWQLAEAVYSSQYPAGAEGTSVDNILALNNLRRLPATATRTNQVSETEANGITLYGLVFYGTPGTLIISGSIIQTNASPPLQFSVDSPVMIEPAVNEVQSLFQSNTPNTGSFSLSIEDPAGNDLTTELIPYNALPVISQLNFSVAPVTGSFSLSLTAAGVTLTTSVLPYTAAASDIQTAIQALAGYSAVTVSGSFTAGFQITWGAISNPKTVFATNTLGVTATPIDSIQAAINTLHDSTAGNYPYTDVLVSTNSAGYTFTFGTGTVVMGQPVSSSTPQALFIVATNTLQMGSTVTNISIVSEAQGAPAQGIGSATCLTTGPNFVGAGNLNSIGSPVSGWTGVTNQLDCITGTLVENDTNALTRREANLEAQANGPLQAIVEKVSLVTGVTAAIGFENVTEAALQIISFPIAPTSGAFVLVVGGMPTASIPYNATSSQVETAISALSGYSAVLVTGDVASGFTVDFNGSIGGQPQELIAVSSNTTGGAINVTFGRPGKSFEIVVAGGTDAAVAAAIYGSKPAGIQSYGTTTVQVFDSFGNAYNISFSRPTQVPFYVTIVLQTDYTSADAQFNPTSIGTIQEDIVAIGNAVGIGGLVIGFGTDGLVGAFNSVKGIKFYTLYFGRTPNPTTNTNVQMQPEEQPVFQSFDIAVSYT